MALRLTFCGGAGKVTGSNFLVESTSAKLLVDCGLEQGADVVIDDVYGPFPYEPRAIDALIVTHAHLDHVGRIPKLVKDGFSGKIYSTAPTKDLAALILQDAVMLLSHDAARRTREPLYTAREVEAALALWEPLPYHEERLVAPTLSVYLRNTGHVLGSASVRVRDEDGTTIALTGDIGNSPSPLLPDSEPVPDADVLVMESVYGNRIHPSKEMRVQELHTALAKAIERGGTILIPAFSLERTELMLYELSNFFSEGSLPKVPVYLDSPLAIRVKQVYEKWGPTYFKQSAKEEIKKEGNIFEFPFLTETLSHEESAAIEKVANPKIIIAGAGMSHGGRIEGWEKRFLPDPRSTLFIVGYQAPGSPGRHLAEDARVVRLGSEEVEVKATVVNLEGWSAHADRDELLSFAEQSLAGKRLKTIFVALGEPSSERFLAQRLHDYLGARAIAPEAGQTWEITTANVRKLS